MAALCRYRCKDRDNKPRYARKAGDPCDTCKENLRRRSLQPMPLIEQYAETLRVRSARTTEVLHPTRGGFLAHVIQRRKAREKDHGRRRETRPRQRRATHHAPAHESVTTG
jgi:hypothetical protein